MKKLLLALSFAGMLMTSATSFAQNQKNETKQEKKEARKEKDALKQAKQEQENIMSIETLNFSFTPETVTPEFGMQHEMNITSLFPYVNVDKDNFTARLPYMGNFYIQPEEPSQVPIEVYSSQFLYAVHTTDGVTFDVTIVPSDTVNILNESIRFNFTLNKNTGAATLVVSAENRDSITFTGYFNNN